VSGLTTSDTLLLDIFEGDVCVVLLFLECTIDDGQQEYTRTLVSVHPLSPLTRMSNTNFSSVASSIIPQTASPLPSEAEMELTVEAEVYMWSAPLSRLKRELWSYETFIKENAWKWVGNAAEENEDYTEVDRRRDMEGNIV